MTGFVQVITTTKTEENGYEIAQCLLDRHLAGCVQIHGPVTSAYRWKGRIETDQEWICVIKTSASRYTEVEREIRDVHPYEEPEVIAFPMVLGSATYLEWLANSLK